MSRFSIFALSAGLAWSLTFPPTLSAAEEHGHTHGEPVALGKTSIGTTAVTVTGAGELVAGKEWHVGVVLASGAPAPKAIRVWIGAENGRGSEKARALKATEGNYEAHVAVPKPLVAGSAVWVALESATGEIDKGSVPLPGSQPPKPHDHRHD